MRYLTVLLLLFSIHSFSQKRKVDPCECELKLSKDLDSNATTFRLAYYYFEDDDFSFSKHKRLVKKIRKHIDLYRGQYIDKSIEALEKIRDDVCLKAKIALKWIKMEPAEYEDQSNFIAIVFALRDEK